MDDSEAEPDTRRYTGTDPIEWVAQDHKRQLGVCDALEAIADNLPEPSDASLLEFVIPILRVEFSEHMKFEDDVLFACLRTRSKELPELEGILNQLEHEHQVDEFYGEELANQLSEMQFRGAVSNPNMLGYMLRGFFEAQRRHIEWENNVVLPLARKVLTEADLKRISFSLPSAAGFDSISDIQRSGNCTGNCPDCSKKSSS